MQKQDQKNFNFIKWMRLNGALIDPALQIPSFKNGTVGASSTQDIQSHKVILSIPQKLILSAEKVYSLPQLKRLFSDNDDLFDYQACDQNQFNILAVFLMYEKSKVIKGKKQNPGQQFHSFWQPYFQAASQCSTILDWPQSSYSDLPHSFKEQIVFFQIQMTMLKLNMINYLQKRNQFRGVSSNQLVYLFDWAYRFVMTRCFGQCVRTTCLVPVVDMFNHGNHTIDHRLMNIQKQKQENPQHYTKASGVLDLSILGLGSKTDIDAPYLAYLQQQTKETQSQLLYLNRQQTYNRLTKVNQKKFIQSNRQQLFSLQFHSEDDSEDNDTQNDQQQEKEMQMMFLVQQQKQQMEIFKKQYKQFKLMTYKESQDQLKINKKTDDHMQNITEDIKQELDSNSLKEKNQLAQQKCIKQQDELTQITQIKNTQTQDSQNIKQPQTQKLQKVEAQKTQLVEKPQPEQDQNHLSEQAQRQQQNQSSSSEQSSSDCSLQTPQWYSNPGTYFSLYTLYSIPANTELYISYGSRTNKFLLMWYGFCYPNNHYDSVSFRLNASFENQLHPQKLLFDHYYLQTWRQNPQTNPHKNVSKQFRLKRTKISEGLIMFMRVFLMNQYKGKDQTKLMGTAPSSIQFQVFLFSYLIKLFEALKKKYPKDKIQQWRNQQQKQLTSKFKRIFFQQQVKIIDENILMSESIIKVLTNIRNSQQQKDLKSAYNNIQFKILRKIRKYVQLIFNNIDYILYNPQLE